MAMDLHKRMLHACDAAPISHSDCHIALVPSLGLGDSLIYLVLANNLALAGYRVTMLSNHLAHFADWLPNFAVLPFPKREETHSLAGDYDLVLSDCGGIVVGLDRDPLQLAKHYVFVGTLRVDPAYILDHSARVEQRCGPEKAVLMSALSRCAGAMRVIDDPSVTMVEQAVAFCRTRLGIERASSDPGFSIPADHVARRYPQRVMLHPTSYNRKKNWPAQKYLRLARRLKRQGYDPQFVLSPKERAEWSAQLGDAFPIPHFANARELAVYLYESGYIIGNDSGVGHLGAALGVPVLTVYRKRRDGFCWRPGWGNNLVVRPLISLGAVKNAWKYFLSVGRVERAFGRLVAKSEVQI